MQTPSVVHLTQNNKVGSPLSVTAGSALAYEVKNTSGYTSILANGGGGFVRIGPGQSVYIENGGAAVATIELALPQASYTWFSCRVNSVADIPVGETGAAVRITKAVY